MCLAGETGFPVARDYHFMVYTKCTTSLAYIYSSGMVVSWLYYL